MHHVVCLAAVAALVAGCDTPNTRFAQLEFGDAKALAAGGNLRLITERTRFVPNGTDDRLGHQKVICTEPSPDYLVTFDRSATGKAQGNFVANGTATFEGSVTSNEVAGSNGAGRTQGVLALRDGLYAACQAYANGVIGQDAYSAVLSQYGILIAAVTAGPTAVATTTSGAITNQGPAFVPAASAFSAVLVACLSGYDPTRLSRPGGNAVLDLATCRQIVRRAGSGGASRAPHPVASRPSRVHDEAQFGAPPDKGARERRDG